MVNLYARGGSTEPDLTCSVNDSHKVTPVALVKQGSIQIVSQTLPTGTALGREEAATFS